MGRRSDHSREELYALAMEGARGIVVAQGWRKLTARSLAKEMGYSVGTLYNLFANTDDLVLHLNAGTLERLEESLAAVTLSGAPAADLDALLDAYVAFLAENANLWAVLFEHHLPPDQSLPDWYRERVGRLLGILESALAPLFAENEAAERARAARVLWSGLHGIFSLAALDKLDSLGGEAPTAMASHLIQTYLAGLRNR